MYLAFVQYCGLLFIATLFGTLAYFAYSLCNQYSVLKVVFIPVGFFFGMASIMGFLIPDTIDGFLTSIGIVLTACLRIAFIYFGVNLGKFFKSFMDRHLYLLDYSIRTGYYMWENKSSTIIARFRFSETLIYFFSIDDEGSINYCAKYSTKARGGAHNRISDKYCYTGKWPFPLRKPTQYEGEGHIRFIVNKCVGFDFASVSAITPRKKWLHGCQLIYLVDDVPFIPVFGGKMARLPSIDSKETVCMDQAIPEQYKTAMDKLDSMLPSKVDEFDRMTPVDFIGVFNLASQTKKYNRYSFPFRRQI